MKKSDYIEAKINQLEADHKELDAMIDGLNNKQVCPNDYISKLKLRRAEIKRKIDIMRR